MTPSFELLLVLGAFGIYLFDSAMLLAGREIVLINKGKDWAFAVPRTRWQLKGKNFYLPNPFTPGRPLFRIQWYGDGGGKHTPPKEQGFTQVQELAAELGGRMGSRTSVAMGALGIATSVLSLLLAIGLPLSLLVFHSPAAFLGLLAVVYPTILLMLVLLFRRSAALGISRREFWKLAFDSLACAPLAVNVVRRISLRDVYRGDPLQFAAKTGSNEALRVLSEQLREHVDHALQEEEEGSAVFNELTQYRKQLAGSSP